MVPKTYSLLSLALLFCFSLIAENPPAEAVNNLRPSLRFDFENCVAFGGGSSADYSEFIAQSIGNSDCTGLSVFGDHLYRLNPNRNSHSCAPGLNGTSAMCISANEMCSYFAGHEQSLRVNVMVTPGPDGLGSLDNISFFSMAPEEFTFINGVSGLNNYPTKFAIRILTDNGEVYRNVDIETAREWTYRSFDLSSISATTVSEPTLFRIEILPYCLAGVDSNVQAWDIEDLVITGGCNNVNGGVISTSSDLDLCSVDGQSQVVNSTVQNAKGQEFRWLVADEQERIVAVYASGNIGFNTLPNGNLRVFHIAYEGPLAGLSSGMFLFDLLGCYDLSNSISVVNNKVAGGRLFGPGQSSVFSVCPNSASNTLVSSLTGASGDNLSYVLTDSNGQIVNIYNSGSIDFSNLSQGNFTLQAVSYAGSINGLFVGSNLASLSGCFAVSSAITINRLDAVEGGTLITSGGQSTFTYCNNTSSLSVVSTGAVGPNQRFIITNAQGRILSIQSNPSVVIDGISETNYSVRNISYANGLSGLFIDGLVSNLSGCFDLSNPIAVTRDEVNGGSITANGLDVTFLCLKNNDNQAVTIDATGQIGANILYLITDEAGSILEVTNLDNQGSLDFDNVTPGICLIWAVAYNGSLSGAVVGNNAANITGSCFDLSNPLRVVRNGVESGVIDGPSTYTLCLNNQGERSLDFTVSGATANFTTWIVTDVDGNVLETNTTGTVDLSMAPTGTCLVYHLSHVEEEILYGASENVSDITLGCFELSSPVTVHRKLTDGGSLSLENGGTSVTLLLGQGASASLSTVLEGAIGDSSVYIVYDEEGLILETQQSNEFDFNTAGPGVCLIVNASYCTAATGSGSGIGNMFSGAVPGGNIDMIDGCFSFSNRIQVIREISVPVDTLNAGVIVTSAGSSVADICIGDGSVDSLSVVFTTDPIGAQQDFVITDDLGFILEITDSSTLGFANADSGVCNVYHVVYDQAPLAGLEVGAAIGQLDGSFDLSSPITVIRNVVSGSMLFTSDSLTTVTITVGDGIVDTIDLIVEGGMGDNSTIILTDTLGRILEIPDLPLVFDDGPAGVCLAWNITFADGLQGLEPNALVPSLDGCFTLSNPVRINKEAFMPPTISGGNLLSSDSLTTIDVCIGGGSPIVDVVLSGAVGDTTTYVITDDAGIILEIDPIFPLDISGAGIGVCLVYNVSYNGSIAGLEVSSDIDDLVGNFALSNAVVVNRDLVAGGSLMTSDSLTAVTITVGDGVVDTVDFILEGNLGDNSVLLLTDTLGRIQGFPTLPLTFDDEPAGVCLVWNLSHADGLQGLELNALVASLEGCFTLSNPVTITKEEIVIPGLSGGSLTSSDSLTTIDVCISGGAALVDVILTGAVGDTLAYVITDAAGVILEVNPSFPLDISGAGVGVCFVYNVSYNGTIAGLVVNDNIADLSGSFDLSNALVVNRDVVNGGMLMTTDSMTSVSIIVDDGMIDSIDVILNAAVGDTTIWLVTDTLGNILELPTGPPFIFESAGAGVCQIWNLSAAFGLTGVAVDNNVNNIQGCFSLSNPIEVIRTTPVPALSGGSILTGDSLTVANTCVGTPAITVDVLLEGAVGETMGYVVTDTTGFIWGVFNSPPFQFSGLAPGICEINHISYNGMIVGLNAGQNIDTLSGDFDLSNTITVIRDEVGGGEIMTTDSLTEVTITVGDGMIDSIEVVLANAIGDTTSWLVTDTLGNILELPDGPIFTFENAGAGVCNIWSISYAFGLAGLEVGENVADLDGCFLLSNNIEVTRNEILPTVSGGSILTTDSMVVANVCIGTADVLVDVLLDGAIGDTMTYVITDTFGVIQVLQDTMPYSFNGFSGDVCLIWHLSYTGTLSGLTVGENASGLSGNFDLSNAITVTKSEVEGGLVQFSDSTFTQTIIVGDGMPDTLNVTLAGASGDTMNWVLTTSAGLIQEISSSSEFIFDDNIAPGICRINNISYATGLSGLAVGNNINFDLDGCFDNSNFLIIDKQAATNDSLIAGTIMTADSLTTIDVCVGDNGISVDLILENVNGPSMSWVVTDTAGVILATPATEPIDFAAGTSQTCEIQHIVFDSALVGFAVGEDLDTLAGNFLLSNTVTVNKTQLAATSIELADGTVSASVITADGNVDSLTVVSAGIAADTSVYVVTDTFGIITSVQDSTLFLFENQATGVCLIWEVSFNTGFTGLFGGVDVANLTGCFAISNPITVTKTSAAGTNGGVITTALGNNVEQCLSDPVIDSLLVSLSGFAGDTTSWVIADTFGIILELPDGPPFAFDGLTAGSCQVLHVAYQTSVTGLAVGNNISGLSGGLFDFSNPINVDKNSSIGGSLTTATGMSFDTIVLGSNPVDSLFVTLANESGENTSWVVTDTLGNITNLTAVPPFTFEGTPPGQCQVWNISYADGISGLQVGSNINTDLSGCFSFSDSIQVIKVSGSSNLVSAGSIIVEGGASSIDVCLGNAVVDSASVVIAGASASNYSFLIANTNGFIISVDSTLTSLMDTMLVNVEGPPAATLELFLVAYESPIMNLSQGGSVDPTANNYLQGVFDISNPIVLNNISINAGALLQDSLTITVGDGMEDLIDVTSFGTIQGDTMNWIVYDSLGVITSIDAGPPFNFENSGGGIFHIELISYAFGLQGLSVGSNVADLDGCFDTSGAYVITAIPATLAGGSLMTTDSTTMVDFCFNSDYTLDSIEVILTDTLGETFAWVITDADGVIVDLPATAPFIIDDMDPDTCSIWNLSYEGTISGLTVGENVDTLMGDFLFSNPIVVSKEVVNGGSLASPSGQTVFSFCVGDGLPNVINFMLADTLGGNYQYVVTDTFGSIILVPAAGISFLDFEGFGEGACDVYNLSSSDEILGLTIGMNVDSLVGCYELSNNLRVIKNGVDGNAVMSSPLAIDNNIEFCVTDGILDSLTLSTLSTMGSYQFVITDENDVIDTVLVGNIIDFEGSGFGVCRIYGVSYTGNFIGAPGDTIGVDPMSDECEDISDLPITVTKADCSMPIITEIGGNGQIEIQNVGTAPIDVSPLFLCGANSDYTMISSLSVVCGSTLLQPNDYVVIEVPASVIAINPADGEFALYRSSSFGSSAEIMHYTEWGSSPHNRTSVAVAADLWMNAQFATPFTANTALKYDGVGFLPTDWSEGNSTPCAPNLGGTGTVSKLSYTTYPNPAYQNFSLYIPDLPTEDGMLLIYDSFGKVIETRKVLEGIQYEIDLKDYDAGVYYTKVIAGREGVVKKMILIK